MRLIVAMYVYRQMSKVAYPAVNETSFHFCSYVHRDIKMCKNPQSLPNDSVAAVGKENVKNDGLLYCFLYHRRINWRCREDITSQVINSSYR